MRCCRTTQERYAQGRFRRPALPCTSRSRLTGQFSHDLDVGRKVDKADIYTDARADDTMDKWDDAKLKSVVLSKHGNVKTTTE